MIPFHNFTQTIIINIIIPILFLIFFIITPTSTINNSTMHTTFPNHTFPMQNSKPLNKLRRLPHVFSKVLELTPLNSDADVYVQEYRDCFKFVAKLDQHLLLNGKVKTRVLEIHPGITKVVIQVREDHDYSIDEDVWRFRLPGSARAELATAAYAHGELVVTVPKIGCGHNVRNGGDCKGGFKGNMGNLVLVQ